MPSTVETVRTTVLVVVTKKSTFSKLHTITLELPYYPLEEGGSVFGSVMDNTMIDEISSKAPFLPITPKDARLNDVDELLSCPLRLRKNKNDCYTFVDARIGKPNANIYFPIVFDENDDDEMAKESSNFHLQPKPSKRSSISIFKTPNEAIIIEDLDKAYHDTLTPRQPQKSYADFDFIEARGSRSCYVPIIPSCDINNDSTKEECNRIQESSLIQLRPRRSKLPSRSIFVIPSEATMVDCNNDVDNSSSFLSPMMRSEEESQNNACWQNILNGRKSNSRPRLVDFPVLDGIKDTSNKKKCCIKTRQREHKKFQLQPRQGKEDFGDPPLRSRLRSFTSQT